MMNMSKNQASLIIALLMFVVLLLLYSISSNSGNTQTVSSSRYVSSSYDDDRPSHRHSSHQASKRRARLSQMLDDDEDDEEIVIVQKPSRQSASSSNAPAAATPSGSSLSDLIQQSVDESKKVSVEGIHIKSKFADNVFPGQVTMGTTFGQALYNLAKQSDVQLVLEIGTWRGGGSSTCLGKGLSESSGRMMTIEAHPNLWAEAQARLAPYPVTCLLGVAVGCNDLSSQADVERMFAEYRAEHGRPTDLESSTPWRTLWEEEANLCKTYTKPLLSQLCKDNRKTNAAGMTYSFDLVLLDGAEYTGPAEFEVTHKECQPRYIAMHDTLVFKNYWARKRLLAPGSGYKLVNEERHGAGWSVFKREGA